MTLTRALAFLGAAEPLDSLDYLSRLSRLRWKRVARAERIADWRAGDSAADAVAQAGSWVVVRDRTAMPVPGDRIPEPPYRRVLLADDVLPSYVHTLRELEVAPLRTVRPPSRAASAALAFWAADFAPAADETVEAYLARLLGGADATLASAPAFRALRFDEPSRRERPELTRRLPGGTLRILDVGCGAGGGIAEGRARNAGWHVTGVEREAALAAQAKTRCDRVVEGDLREVLPRLARDGERFDALVFADVLEHLEDPFGALRAARPLAAGGARLLVSVPNVGHLSVVRDLLCGRFDPVPAGLLDAGHLRWFTRDLLAQVLEETGWTAVVIEGEAGAPSPEPGPMLELSSAWPDWDARSLHTYQWIAEAQAP